MEMPAKIAHRVKELREKKDLTQEALAWRSEIDRTFMNHIENGRRNITVKTLEKIVMHGLEMTLQEFFNAQIFSKA